MHQSRERLRDPPEVFVSGISLHDHLSWMALPVAGLLLLLGQNLPASASASGPVGQPLTPADAVETTRFMPVGANGEETVSVSPDGRRYVVRLLKGDVKRNGLWVDVLTGSLDSLSAAIPVTVAHLFSTGRGVASGYGGPSADGYSTLTPLHWINDRKVAFLFSDAHETRQVVMVDLLSKQTVFETDHATQTQSFDMAANGALVYLADTPQDHWKTPASPGGYVVPEGIDANSIAQGYFDGSTADSRAARGIWYLKPPSGTEQRIVLPGPVKDGGYPTIQHVTLSPDGKHAILSAPASAIPSEWDRYVGQPKALPAPDFYQVLRAARADPSSNEARRILQLFSVDVDRNIAAPLWDATIPYRAWTSGWAPDGKRVILSPIPIPIAEQREPNPHLQMVLFDVERGTHWIVPAEAPEYLDDQKIIWKTDQEFEIDSRASGGGASGKIVRKCYAFVAGAWQSDSRCDTPRASTPSAVRVEVQEDLNTPPRLVARTLHGGSWSILLDPNPTLTTRFKLGEVRHLDGNLSTGEHWSALLTLPSHYEKGRRYPLVLEMQGGTMPVDRFSLYGWPNDGRLGPSMIATYATQILAGRDIAVIHFRVNTQYTGPSEGETTQRAFEEIAGKLIGAGIADPRRIGICGFSRAGYYAYHAISHSHLPFAAAVVVDNVDYSYLQVVLGNRYGDAESEIGAPASGEGLKTWLERATGFNADAIREPVLLIGQSSGAASNILDQWEILSQLRWMKRPVEMYLMPEIDAHPSHTPQNPAQVIAIQERTADWFDFWLNGYEMAGEGKVAQYERWRAFRQRMANNDERSAPP